MCIETVPYAIVKAIAKEDPTLVEAISARWSQYETEKEQHFVDQRVLSSTDRYKVEHSLLMTSLHLLDTQVAPQAQPR